MPLSVLPDLTGLNDFEREIFDFVLERWPTTPLEIASNFNEDVSDREKKRRLSTKYAYYLKKLVEKRLIMSKKAGNSIIVWPLVVEKYRAIHQILGDHRYEYDKTFISKKIIDSDSQVKEVFGKKLSALKVAGANV